MEVVDHAQDASGTTDFTEEGEDARSDQQTVRMRAGVGESQGSVDGIRLRYRKGNGAIDDRAQKLMQRRVRDGRLRLCAGGTQHREAGSTTLRIAQQSGLAHTSFPSNQHGTAHMSARVPDQRVEDATLPAAAIQHGQSVNVTNRAGLCR